MSLALLIALSRAMLFPPLMFSSMLSFFCWFLFVVVVLEVEAVFMLYLVVDSSLKDSYDSMEGIEVMEVIIVFVFLSVVLSFVRLFVLLLVFLIL